MRRTDQRKPGPRSPKWVPRNTRPPESLPQGLGLSWQISFKKTIMCSWEVHQHRSKFKKPHNRQAQRQGFTLQRLSHLSAHGTAHPGAAVSAQGTQSSADAPREMPPRRPLPDKGRSASPWAPPRGRLAPWGPQSKEKNIYRCPARKPFQKTAACPHNFCKGKCIREHSVYVTLVSTLTCDECEQLSNSPPGFPAAPPCTAVQGALGARPVTQSPSRRLARSSPPSGSGEGSGDPTSSPDCY